MADDAIAVLGDQRQGKIAIGAQAFDDIHLTPVAMFDIGKGGLGDDADLRAVGSRLGPDRERAHGSRCPARSRLVAR